MFFKSLSGLIRKRLRVKIYGYTHTHTHTHTHVVLVSQLCLTLCDTMDSSPPDSSVHGILQARILEWVAISFSKGSSQPRECIQVSSLAGRFFTI